MYNLPPKSGLVKHILLFGAGKSATVLIDYLLAETTQQNWKITVADANESVAAHKINGHPNGQPVGIDINDEVSRKKLIEQADIVISMMPPALHILVAKDCILYSKHLLTASYADQHIYELEDSVKERNLLFLCEMGLDPGIDHMSALQILDDLKQKGAKILSFKSHCGGLVAPESDNNPWHYKISWNPRNVVLAGKAGAIYREDGKTVTKNYEELFNAGKQVRTGDAPHELFSYYPNRNSLSYIDLYQLHDVHTFERTTLRHPDFMFGWKNIVDLKLTDENIMYETDGLSLHAFFKQHLEQNGFGEWLQIKLQQSFAETKDMLNNLMQMMEAEIAAQNTGEEIPENFMVVDESGDLKELEIDSVKENAANTVAHKMHEANLIMKQLFFMGMDDEETIINKGRCSAADVMQFILENKLVLMPHDKDMIVMLHEIEYELNGKLHTINSSLTVKGADAVHTAMAKTVGLPLGIAAKLILNGQMNLSGVHVPVIPAIYNPVLEELQKQGIVFKDLHF